MTDERKRKGTEMKTQLEVNVAARNLVNQVANEAEPMLREVFANFVGKKVRLKDGGLTKEAAQSLKKVSDYFREKIEGFSGIWLAPFNNDLGFEVKVYVRGEGEFNAPMKYESVYVMIGRTPGEPGSFQGGQVLTGLTEVVKTDRRDTYTVGEIQAARLKVQEAQAALRLAQDALKGFGEY